MNVSRMWVIYDKPNDYPRHVVVRKWTATSVGHLVAGPAQLFDSIDDARRSMGHGLYAIPRSPEDDPFIVETWM